MWVVEFNAWDMDEDGESYSLGIYRYIVVASNTQDAIVKAEVKTMNFAGVYGCSLYSVTPYKGDPFFFIP